MLNPISYARIIHEIRTAIEKRDDCKLWQPPIDRPNILQPLASEPEWHEPLVIKTTVPAFGAPLATDLPFAPYVTHLTSTLLRELKRRNVLPMHTLPMFFADYHGTEFAEAVREHHFDVPFVFFECQLPDQAPYMLAISVDDVPNEVDVLSVVTLAIATNVDSERLG